MLETIIDFVQNIFNSLVGGLNSLSADIFGDAANGDN